jgi:hypothetical protein
MEARFDRRLRSIVPVDFLYPTAKAALPKIEVLVKPLYAKNSG